MKDRIYAALLNGLLSFLAALPFWANQGLGFVLGWGFILLPNKPKRIARINLALCFPALSRWQRQRLLMASLVEMAKTVTELGAVWRWPPSRVLPLIRQVHGESLVQQALAAGHGLILAAPHLGAWELTGAYCDLHYAPVTYLYRPPRQAWVEQILCQVRQRFGARLVPTDVGGVRALYRALAANQVIGILPDHEASLGEGVFVPLFQVNASTPVLLSRLTQKQQTPVILVYAERLSWGRGFHLHFVAAEPGIYAADKIQAATAINAQLETCIRQIPAQYQWNYKRFRSQPQGLDRVY